MNALARIHAVHDMMVEGVDQLICEGVEMEDISYGDTLFHTHALAFKNHTVLRVEYFSGAPVPKWDEHWRTRVHLIYAAEYALLHTDKIEYNEYGRFRLERAFRERLAHCGHHEWRGYADDRGGKPDGVRFTRREIPHPDERRQVDYEERIIFCWQTVEWVHS